MDSIERTAPSQAKLLEELPLRLHHNAYVVKVVGTDRWRALFDLQLDGTAPVDLRLFLKLGNKTLSETWLYQYFP